MVVDLKTGKYPPTDKSSENPQLGLYQHAVDHGAVDDLVEGRASSGRRRAVAAAQGDRGRAQGPGAAAADARRGGPCCPVERQLMQAAAALRLEEFPARPERARCERCQFAPFCPAQVAGSVLS